MRCQSDLLKKMRLRPHIVIGLIAIRMLGQTQTPPLGAPAQTPAKTPAQPGQAKPGTKTPDPNAPIDPNTPIDPSAPIDPNAKINPKPIEGGEEATASDEQLADPNGQPAGGDYTGPSILSRGFNFARPAVPRDARFRPFAGLNALYDSGLAGPYLGPNGKITNVSSAALDGSFGISGRKYRRRDVFELDYRGHLYYYAGATSFNGQDHSLAAGYTRYVSSRLLLSLHENFGLYSNTYSVLNATAITDVSTANVSVVVSPNTESFDSKTYFSSTELDAVYQQSARMSFNLGVSGFLVKRNSVDLANSIGYQARADMAYRVTKRSTLGVYYAYTTYSFSHVFGNSDVHTAGGEYSYTLSKTLSFKARAGISRVEVYGLNSVTLDPVVAAILGQTTGIAKYYSVSYVPDFSGTLNKSLRHASLGLSFAEGVSPGNGLYLTSRHESESAYYTYNGIRRYTLGVAAGRDSLGSIGDVTGSYFSYYGRINASRSLPRHLNATLSFDYRKLGFSYSGYGRNEYRISTGLTYAAGEGPLKFW